MATRETKPADQGATEENGDGVAPGEVEATEEVKLGEVKHDLPDKETCTTVLRKMMLIRRFEERAGEMYAKAKIGGFLHLCIGEEATVVGATQALRETDYLMSTYREHGQALARGTEAKAVMAELFGRVDGCSSGRGGSMHLFDWDKRFLGGYGIVGGSLPLSAGVALACDYMETDDAIVSMMGDGATNQGTFGETMNLAALWKLPVVFVIINNQFGMGTALHRHSAVTDLSLKSEGYGVPGTRCDGMDALDVHSVVTEALRCAREDRSPQLVEAVTYRYRGHSMADPEEYRTKEEVEEWRERDPIKAFADRLVDEGVIAKEDIEKFDEEAIGDRRRGGQVRRRLSLPRPRLALRRHLRPQRGRAHLVDRRRALPGGPPRRARARGRRGAPRAGREGRSLRRRGRPQVAQGRHSQGSGPRGLPAGRGRRRGHRRRRARRR